MKIHPNKLRIFAQVFIGFSCLALGYVALLAVLDPRSVMELVEVELSNTDALSSIRGIYGGVGLSLVVALVYLMLKQHRLGLWLLLLIWGSYALMRILTIIADGPLGDFGQQWLFIEAGLAVVAATLLLLQSEIDSAEVADLPPTQTLN